MDAIEQLQAAYCAETSREYRRSLGQFFTPQWIADGMAEWVVANTPDEILDPACGFGVLLDACRRRGYTGRLVGCEIDAQVVQRSQGVYHTLAMSDIRCIDFLESLPKSIEAAVVNPPYNRFQHRGLPEKLLLELVQTTGMLASGYTNQYALFLYLVLTRLRPGGRAAFIVPSEFLATGYGVQVKQFLLKNRRLRHLVLFDTKERIFPEAATTACVLLFDSGTVDTLQIWHMTGACDARQYAALCAGAPVHVADASIAYDKLDARINWQGLGRDTLCLHGYMPLGFFGNIKRGIATGANEFFVLRPSEVSSLGLAVTDTLPCIASADSASGVVFSEKNWNSLRLTDRPCYLFDGLAGCSNAAKTYVKQGEAQGFHLRYLTKTRKPWYRLESRQPAPVLLAVFGRSGFRVSWNQTRALNLTAFHGFYAKSGFERFSPVIWLYFQTATAHAAFALQQRAYGDGLKKLEPGDWSKLLVPDWRSLPEVDWCLVQGWAEAAITTASTGGNIATWTLQLDALLQRAHLMPMQAQQDLQLALV